MEELRATDGRGRRTPGHLLQVLGVGFGIAVLVGNTVGMGILRTPGEVARHLPSVPLFFAVWVAGATYALLGTLTLAELGAMRPTSGGMYPLVRGSLGRLPGIVAGWSDWLALAGSAAAVAMVLAEYAAPVVPGLPGGEPLAASAVIFGVALLQSRGVREGKVMQQVTSLLKGLALLALAAVAFWTDAGAPAAAPPALASPQGVALAVAVVVALQSAIYTYDGWAGPLYFGAEIVEPGRSIPRSMIAGVLVVLAIYLAMNLAFLRVMAISEMAGDPFVAGTAAHRLFGPRGDTVLRLIMIMSMLAAVNALVMMYSRIPYAMSRDGELPETFARVNAGGTPVVSLWAGTALATGLTLSNTFGTVLAIVAFWMVTNYALVFTGFFHLRWTAPHEPRPFRVPLYPLVPGLALAGSLAFLAAAVVGDPWHSAAAVALLAFSVPLAVATGWHRARR